MKKIRKGLTVEQLFSALEILKQYQFDKHCFLSFIIGFPWETMEMINKTLDTIELICTKQVTIAYQIDISSQISLLASNYGDCFRLPK